MGLGGKIPSAWFLWGGWVALLTLPFVGATSAVQIALAVGIGGIALHMARRAPIELLASRILQTASSGLSIAARHTTLLLGAALLALLTLPLHANNYVIDVATTTLIYIILALGLNLVVGQTGLLHLGYVAFYGIGAYTYALLSSGAHASFWIGLPAAMGAAAVFGLVLGFPILRLRGDYLAIVTLGFGEVTRLVLRNWDEVTNGPNGILGIGRPSLGGWVLDTPASFYYCVLVFALLVLFAMRRVFQSRIGRAWVAIREDELAARTVGIDVARYKLLAFALGAAVAGLGGSVFAAKMTFVSPESFTFFESVIILCMVVLGGMGSLPGVVLGAAVITILPEVLRGVSEYRMLIFGAAMVLMMVFRPQGLIGSRSLAYEFRRPDARAVPPRSR